MPGWNRGSRQPASAANDDFHLSGSGHHRDLRDRNRAGVERHGRGLQHKIDADRGDYDQYRKPVQRQRPAATRN